MNETNKKTQFDTSQPFIAILPNEFSGGYFERTHGVYLVNPLDQPLTKVYESVGGFFSTDDGVIEAKPNVMGPFEVQPHSALRLEVSSEDELDELECWWSIAYEVSGERHTKTFDAGKGLRQTSEVEVCPVLGRRLSSSPGSARA